MLGVAGRSPATVGPLPPGALRCLYAWLDGLPLSRPRRHLARDFSDGVLTAEIVKHFQPQLVDLHNYVPTCNTDQKLSNWSTLNRKVFSRLHFCVSEADIRKVAANTPGAVEPILCTLRVKVEEGVLGRSPPCEAGPGPSGPSDNHLWPELSSHKGTAGLSPLVLCGQNTLPDQQAPEEEETEEELGFAHPGQPLPHSRDMAGWPPEARGRGVQQLPEEKEQALAVLQEMVKILQVKAARLEQLVKLKDLRIQELVGLADKAQRQRPWRTKGPRA